MSQRAVEIAKELVDRLLALGVREAVLSPGSRSGPLALALHAADEQNLIRLHVRVDEREAGFLALGLAKGGHRPVPAIVTSGTAVANLHPALLEARHTGVEVIAVTADRPARLRGTGASQTTDQRAVFGHIPFIESVDALRRGPVHLNLEFDEPLVEHVTWAFGPVGDAARVADAAAPVVLVPGPRTVVVAGDDAGPGARRLAQEGNWPLLAEPASGSRSGPALVNCRHLVDTFGDQVERVVSFGHPTLSRQITGLLGRADVDVVHVGTQATFPVPAGPRVTFVDAAVASDPDAGDWLASWQQADKEFSATLEFSAPLRVAQAVAAAVPPGGLLFIGPSNPIRDLDRVMPAVAVGERRFFMANRGLAGIDGVLSTAVGAALAMGRSRSIAYVGDLTFLHGLNGLLIGPGEPRPDLTVVVVNDDGGSIFASLEQGGAQYAHAFDRLWRTPTGADLQALCAGVGVAHRRVTVDDLPAALAAPPGGIDVVEVPIEAVRR